ncbi:MAG: DNA polymerase III subunit delta [Hyphomicrobium sp.]|nr:DNA polymerase III subunit delta [Hyphomicrobium sp.]
MVAIKAGQAETFLARPDPKINAWLLYGTDAGLVSERGERLGHAIAKAVDPPGEVLRLDDADMETDPDRLANELLTMPMFGGRKIVRATPGRRLNANLLKPLVAETARPGILIVEAGNLRPDEALRLMFEKPAHAVAIPCYLDEVRDIAEVVRQVLSAHGLAISTDARDLLVSKLGADRVLSRGEVEKLATFAMGQHEISAADVEAIVGDASDLAIDRIINAAAMGDGRRASMELDRAVAAGESPQGMITAIMRHFQRLHRTRVVIDRGQTFDDVVKTIRPPLHFRVRDALAAQCRIWTAAALDAALNDISAAQRAARMNAVLEDQLADRLVMKLAERVKSRTTASATATKV